MRFEVRRTFGVEMHAGSINAKTQCRPASAPRMEAAQKGVLDRDQTRASGVRNTLAAP